MISYIAGFNLFLSAANSAPKETATGLWFYFEKGGLWFMIPLLLGSILSWTIFFYKTFELKRINSGSTFFSETLLNLFTKRKDDKKNGDIVDDAIELCKESEENLITAKIFKSGLIKYQRQRNREEIKEAILDTGNSETPKLASTLPVLSTIANIATLLGLLGTVIGMIGAVKVITDAGGFDKLTPVIWNNVLEGIWTALITTATGLIVAIPSIIFYNYLTNKSNKIISDIEANAIELVDILSTEDHK